MTKTYTLSNGKEVKVTAKNKRVAKKFHGQDHYAYTIVVEYNGYQFKTTFHDSIANYRAGKGASEEMIDTALDCIIMDYYSYDYNPTLRDFMDEFGYDPEDDLGEKVYEACKKTWESFNTIFTKDEIEEVSEFVVDGK